MQSQITVDRRLLFGGGVLLFLIGVVIASLLSNNQGAQKIKSSGAADAPVVNSPVSTNESGLSSANFSRQTLTVQEIEQAIANNSHALQEGFSYEQTMMGEGTLWVHFGGETPLKLIPFEGVKAGFSPCQEELVDVEVTDVKSVALLSQTLVQEGESFRKGWEVIGRQENPVIMGRNGEMYVFGEGETHSPEFNIPLIVISGQPYMVPGQALSRFCGR